MVVGVRARITPMAQHFDNLAVFILDDMPDVSSS
jgi:hypothetical protein